MIRPRAFDAGRLGAVLSCAVLFFAVCVAALAAHWAIDLAGDVLLPHDTYDDVPHGSRSLVFGGAALLGIASLLATLGLALAEARGHDGRLRAVLARSLPLRARTFVALTVAGTLASVAAMGALDDALAGQDAESLADLFGGSLALGAGVTACCALAVGALCSLVVRALARAHRSIVRAVSAFVRVPRARLANDVFARRARARGPRPVAARLARCAAGRAPPLLRFV